VVGEAVVGEAEVGEAEVGEAEVGEAEVGEAVVGEAEVGEVEVGVTVVGTAVVGELDCTFNVGIVLGEADGTIVVGGNQPGMRPSIQRVVPPGHSSRTSSAKSKHSPPACWQGPLVPNAQCAQGM
jgi:hypothetical protein